MCNVRILILTGHGLDHDEDNSRQEKRDMVELNNFYSSLMTCVRRLGD